jgi:PAS domain-containing protein
MAQKAIEIILMRQLASSLATPIFVVDPEGTLLFYNEPAEALLGRRFDEAGEMPFGEWATAFVPQDERGGPVAPESLPLAIALRRRQPAYGRLRITDLTGQQRRIEIVAFPLQGQSGRFLGAVAIFWNAPPAKGVQP